MKCIKYEGKMIQERTNNSKIEITVYFAKHFDPQCSKGHVGPFTEVITVQ